ncbi:aquaporin family protein [Flavobacteriaceae bacterium]|nr:aquaporin family protein [Flavobacteriaceae bacterium]
MKKYSIEFLGTFFLLLISALTENPIAIGLGLASLIYIGAHISGAHYNPAVSIAMFIRGEISNTECFKYTIAQILGAIVGSFFYFMITNNVFQIQPDSNTTKTQFLIAEFIFTFLLVITILFVGTHPKLKDNQFYGVVIGLTVVASQYSIGEISSSVLNPAISLGPSIFNIFNGQGINMSLAFSPYYIFITIVGGVFAAYLFKFYLKEKK